LNLGAVKKVIASGGGGGVHLAWEVMFTKRNKRVLFFGSDRDACEVYPVGRATVGAHGKFMGDGQRRRFFTVPQVTCSSDDPEIACN
ncbi:MAG: hypothetical protein ACI9MR_004825, partial [Myxococcota bacterium]